MKKVSEALDGFFETYGIKDEKNYLGFVGSWNKLIGEEFASHSRPTDIRGTVLLIAVDHPGWMTRIRFEEKRIIKKIYQTFPQLGITTLGFNLVEKLPKPAKIIEDSKIIINDEMQVGEHVVDNMLVTQNVEKDQIPSNDSEFALALKKLKDAMAENIRKDR